QPLERCSLLGCHWLVSVTRLSICALAHFHTSIHSGWLSDIVALCSAPRLGGVWEAAGLPGLFSTGRDPRFTRGFAGSSVCATAVFLQPRWRTTRIGGGLIVRTVLSARRRGQDDDDADHNHDQNEPRIELPMGSPGGLVSQEDA